MVDRWKSDGELLSEFLSQHTETPFERLLQRYGSLVYGVCLRTLGNSHDAEEAAQAAFLVLAHKAAALRTRSSIAPWLHHVAFHIALRARESAGARRRHEQEAARMAERDSSSEPQVEQLRLCLDQELNALPDKYRLPLILCHLQGHSIKESAGMLGCKTGTLAARLSRGREQLRERLERRGLVLAVSLLPHLLAEESNAMAMPEPLKATIVKQARTISTKQATSTVAVTTSVGTLIEGGLRMLFWAKLKTAAVALLLLAVVGGMTGYVGYGVRAEEPVGPAAAERAGDATPAKPAVDPREMRSILVIEPQETLKVPRLRIPSGLLEKLLAANKPQEKKGALLQSLPTMMAGMAIALALAFGGLWCAHRRSTWPGRVLTGTAAIMVTCLVCAGARADIPVPSRTPKEAPKIAASEVLAGEVVVEFGKEEDGVKLSAKRTTLVDLAKKPIGQKK